LPVINANLSRLLNDVCDFSIEISITEKNDVVFHIVKDGTYADLSSGSGFEKTAAALALRCVLAEISTISKCNFVIIDEVLGRIAKENFDNMRYLYERIAKNYDFIFQITHNEEVKEWHDEIVTVEKINHISHIKVSDNK
jgi:DNA repair exonuclease SbcCD ATPase subunit